MPVDPARRQALRRLCAKLNVIAKKHAMSECQRDAGFDDNLPDECVKGKF